VERLSPDYRKEPPALKGWRPSPKLALIAIAVSLIIIAIAVVAICFVLDDAAGNP
jgi:hypothetical protein